MMFLLLQTKKKSSTETENLAKLLQLCCLNKILMDQILLQIYSSFRSPLTPLADTDNNPIKENLTIMLLDRESKWNWN